MLIFNFKENNNRKSNRKGGDVGPVRRTDCSVLVMTVDGKVCFEKGLPLFYEVGGDKLEAARDVLRAKAGFEAGEMILLASDRPGFCTHLFLALECTGGNINVDLVPLAVWLRQLREGAYADAEAALATLRMPYLNCEIELPGSCVCGRQEGDWGAGDHHAEERAKEERAIAQHS